MSRPAFSIEDLSVDFGGVTALDSLSLDIGDGSLVGLIGPNGAGKTTLIDAVTGFLPGLVSGSVTFDGQELLGMAPHRIARAGIRRTWQGVDLFGDLTVRSNLEVSAGRSLSNRLLLRASESRRARIARVIDQLRLGHIAERLPDDLGLAEQKLVGIGRALASPARVVLLDEPTAGLDAQQSRWLASRLRRLADEGISMLLVDHDVSMVLSVCDAIHVLDAGSLVTSGTPDEIRVNRSVASLYFGEEGG